MTYDEYKAKLDKLREDTAIHSASSSWRNHPLFEELVSDIDAKKYLHELLTIQPSWQLYSIVVRVYPNISIRDESMGMFYELQKDYLNWIEENA